MTAGIVHADDANIPQEKYRHIVMGFFWGELLLVTLTLVLDFATLKTGASAKPQVKSKP